MKFRISRLPSADQRLLNFYKVYVVGMSYEVVHIQGRASIGIASGLRK
jgi:hypothetical protein